MNLVVFDEVVCGRRWLIFHLGDLRSGEVFIVDSYVEIVEYGIGGSHVCL
jgi:hypothetical protein